MLNADALQACAEWLMYDEGFEQFPYDDETGKRVSAPAGKLTIGIGFNLSDAGLSMVECMFILKNRINMLDVTLSTNLHGYSELDEVRQSALINMAYNLGINGLLAFHDFILFVTGNDYIHAANDLRATKVYQELTHRYERISEAILTGKYPDALNINRSGS